MAPLANVQVMAGVTVPADAELSLEKAAYFIDDTLK